MKSSSVLAVLVAAAAFTLSACSSSTSAGSGSVSRSAGADSGTNTAATGSAAGHSAPVSGQPAPATKAGSGRSINVCTALPLATAEKITGVTFSAAKGSSIEGQLFSCEYSGGTNLLQISVTTQFGTHLIETDIDALKQVGHPPTMISGVGDKAFSEPDPNGNAGSAGASAFASYGAVFGEAYIKIGGLTYVNAAQGKQIVELIHSKM